VAEYVREIEHTVKLLQSHRHNAGAGDRVDVLSNLVGMITVRKFMLEHMELVLSKPADSDSLEFWKQRLIVAMDEAAQLGISNEFSASDFEKTIRVRYSLLTAYVQTAFHAPLNIPAKLSQLFTAAAYVADVMHHQAPALGAKMYENMKNATQQIASYGDTRRALVTRRNAEDMAELDRQYLRLKLLSLPAASSKEDKHGFVRAHFFTAMRTSKRTCAAIQVMRNIASKQSTD
jgi:hypothetical protein